MIKKQYLKNKPICKVTFSLPIEAAVDANEVRLLGDFNNWSWDDAMPMNLNKAEYTAMIELEAGRRYEFRYLIDSHIWENDWEADDYIPSPYDGIYNSVVMLEMAEVEAPKPAKPTKTTSKAKAEPKKKATKKAAPTKDDLRKIEGVGPKIATLLNEGGIHTFQDLAKAKNKKLVEILEAAGSRYRMHDPATWPEQAKLAAAGKWEELNTLQEELKGGKRK